MALLYKLMEEIRNSNADYIKLRATQIGGTKVLEKRCTQCREWRPLNYYHDHSKIAHDDSNCALCRFHLVAIK